MATQWELVIIPTYFGQLTCLWSIDAVDYIIENEVPRRQVPIDASSLSFSVLTDCDSAEKLAAILYGHEPIWC